VEKLQLRPTFPDKPLIKIYVALWESCRSIAPLQLLFLEIFKYVDIFKNYAILKTGTWSGSMRRHRPARARAICQRRSHAAHARCTDASTPPLWTTRTPWRLRMPRASYAAPRDVAAAWQRAARPRATARRAALCAPACKAANWPARP
jgi:hypothetical protein